MAKWIFILIYRLNIIAPNFSLNVYQTIMEFYTTLITTFIIAIITAFSGLVSLVDKHYYHNCVNHKRVFIHY